MEKREDALREALTENSNETLRWNAYKQENENAIDNLERFARHLTVDVMVPIGRKAFVPGQLIHTNEVLVGHFQGYFSKCSAHKAQELCRLRLSMANERLTKLEKEAELWQNKLEKPYADGVLPTADQRDIVEFVSEVDHNDWIEKHKLMVKKHKHQEREALEKMGKDTGEMDEAALLAELGEDFKQLNVSEVNDEVLTKLLSGNKTVINDTNSVSYKEDEQEPLEQNKPKCDDIMKMLEEMEKVENEKQELENVEIDSSANEMVHRMMSGSLLLSEKNNRKAFVKEHVADNKYLKSKENTPACPANKQTLKENELPETLEEVETVREEAKYLPLADQVGFYEFQIQIMQEKSKKLDKNKPSYNQEKLRLMDVIVSLTEDLENLQDKIDLVDGIDEEIIEDDVVASEQEVKETEEKQTKKHRRISFALSEEMLEFRKNETVAEMLSKPQEGTQTSSSKRDIISLDEPIMSKTELTAAEPAVHPAELRKQTILDKVAQNLKYVEENQSVHDADLVNKILDATDSRTKTLYIRFKHSNNEPCDIVIDGEVPSTPADFYAQYLKCKDGQTEKEPVYANAYKGEFEVRSPLLSETKRGEAFEDPRTAFSTPGVLRIDSTTTETAVQKKKSILRNKSAVEHETHLDSVNPKNKSTKQQRKKRNEDSINDISAYYKVMNEVTEREISEPDPLPNGKFIEANAPKKRVSRFKQQRARIANSAYP